jgi:DNA-binding transcriptional LysR family regulator
MKKELILHGLAWGHLPAWLIEDEIRDGRLISIAAPHLPGRTDTLAAVRRRRNSHGPVAEALWLQLRPGAVTSADSPVGMRFPE